MTRVADPIHDSFEMTVFDREVVDSPYFQRLHFVLQNSTTYTAYPSNKNSRFVHSLGVAKVAGNMFVNGMNASSHSTLEAFLTQVGQFFETFLKKSSASISATDMREIWNKGWTKSISGKSHFSHSPFLHALNERDSPVQSTTEVCGFSAGFLADTLWQAIRICGLAHDIGHLPMSHSFEMALVRCPRIFELYSDRQIAGSPDQRILSQQFTIGRNFSSDGLDLGEFNDFIQEVSGLDSDDIDQFLASLPIHERRSLYILKKVQDANKFDLSPASEMGMYRRLIYFIAFFILYSSVSDGKTTNKLDETPNGKGIGKIATAKEFAFLRALKTIVAGEIDADRIDYTLRDGYSCGSTIGAFESSRIISNSILVSNGNSFSFAYYDRALSGIEHFFSQRRDSYKYLIFHRTSSRTETCLQELIARVIHFSYCFPTSELAKILDRYRYIELKDGRRILGTLSSDDYALVSQDDASLRSALFEILRYVGGRLVEKEGCSKELAIPIQLLCEIVLKRNFEHIHSPFKYESVERRMAKIYPNEVDAESIKMVAKHLLSDDVFQEYESRLQRMVYAKHPTVIPIISIQRPKTFRKKHLDSPDAQILVDVSGEQLDLGLVSRQLRDLAKQDSGKFTISVHLVSDGIKKKLNLLSDLDDFILASLKQLFDELNVGRKID